MVGTPYISLGFLGQAVNKISFRHLTNLYALDSNAYLKIASTLS